MALRAQKVSGAFEKRAPDAICGLSWLLVLALLQGFFSVLSGFQYPQKPTLQIPIRLGYRTNMKSSLGGIGFLSRCCNLFIILFVLRFEKPSKQAKPLRITLEILRIVHVIRHGSHGTRSRSLDIGQVIFLSVYRPRGSRGTIFSP